MSKPTKQGAKKRDPRLVESSKINKLTKTITTKTKELGTTALTFIKTHKAITGGAAAVVAVAIIAGSLGSAGVFSPDEPYAIYVDGETVAILQSVDLANEVVDDIIAENTELVEGAEVFFAETVEILAIEASEDEYSTTDVAKSAVEAVTTPQVNAGEIVIDGTTAVILGSSAIAESTLENVKLQNIADYPQLEVVDVKFREEVEVVSAVHTVDEVSTLLDAKSYLMNTVVQEGSTYTITYGETIWDISLDLGIAWSDILDMNPDIDPTLLKGGEVLTLVEEVPLLQTVAVFYKEQESIIPYTTIYETDRSLAAGTSYVSQEGVNGTEMVELEIVIINGEETRRTRLDSEVLTESVDKIIVSSSVTTTADRSTSSVDTTGSLLWPTTATSISSYYGTRSSGFHTGLDIDGDYYDPVYAADSGTVVSSGWNGGYGYSILIDHGNGMQTRYAHMSKLYVEAGDTITIGDTIGLVGSTGNSTGSHLHFEVIIDGNTYDPLDYL